MRLANSVSRPLLGGAHGVGTRDREEPTRLLASLDEGHAEMGRDQPEYTCGRCNLDLNGAAWLALGMGDVVDLGRAQWPAAYHHLAVGAVCRDNRFRFDAVPTDGIAQHCKGRTCRRGRLPGIDLLERDDIGLMARDRLHYAGQIEVTVGTDATVNVPCHHANGSASAFQVLRLLQRSSRACAPIETVSQASTAKVKSNMLVSVGSLTMLQSWWPSADIKIRPGAMPMIVPNR